MNEPSILRPYFLILLSVSLLDYVVKGKRREDVRHEILWRVDTSLETAVNAIS